MIKRRFFKQDHGDKSADDDSSESSDSDEEIEAEEEEEARFDENDDDRHIIGDEKETRSGSGYESEDSSENVVEEDPIDLSIDEEVEIPELIHERVKNEQSDIGSKVMKDNKVSTQAASVDLDDSIEADISNYVLKHKSVFKCKLCPRIVCLSEDTVRTHLKSKRHIRSKKLLGEGRLKLMLNSDGEIEEDQETHAERHARTVALGQEAVASKKKDSGRQRQNRRRKKRQQRQQAQSDKNKMVKPTEKPMKKRKTEI